MALWAESAKSATHSYVRRQVVQWKINRKFSIFKTMYIVLLYNIEWTDGSSKCIGTEKYTYSPLRHCHMNVLSMLASHCSCNETCDFSTMRLAHTNELWICCKRRRNLDYWPSGTWLVACMGWRLGLHISKKVKPLTHVNVNLVHLLKVRSLTFSIKSNGSLSLPLNYFTTGTNIHTHTQTYRKHECSPFCMSKSSRSSLWTLLNRMYYSEGCKP